MRANRIPAEVARSGGASKRLTAEVLAYYGTVCWLQLPGCMMRATTKDHVIPVNQGGTDVMENLRPACHACNSKRRDMSIGGAPGGILVTFYLGPLPRYTERAAREAATGEDLLLTPGGLLEVMNPGALTPTPFARQVAAKAFHASVTQALRQRAPIHVRIAHPVPTVKQLQTWARLRYFIDVQDPGRTIAEQDAHATADREVMLEVNRWYDRYPEGPASIERAAARRPLSSTPSSSEPPGNLEPSRAW